MAKNLTAVARVLIAVSHAGTLDRLVSIGNSRAVQNLNGADQQEVAAAVSGRVITGVDYDLPVPRSGA